MRWKPFDYLSMLVVVIGGLALITLIAITGLQVWGRYVLNNTPTWAERLSLLLILVVSLPIAAIGLRENFHLGISVIVELLPPRVQRWLTIFNAVVLIGFGAAMTWYSWALVEGTWNRKIPLLGVPQAFQYLPLVVFGVLIVAFMLERLAFLVLRPGTTDMGND